MRPSRKVQRSRRSLAGSSAFTTFILDQLCDVPGVTARSMFGGVGLYSSGLFFGIIARDRLYLKVDAASRADYERAGMGAFKPYPDRPGTMQYYEVPVGVIESAPDLCEWARKAVAVAGRARCQ